MRHASRIAPGLTLASLSLTPCALAQVDPGDLPGAQVLREEAALGPVNNLTPSKGPREEAFLRHLGFSVTAVREQSLLVLENPP